MDPIDQSPPTSEIEWVCVDVNNYKIVNVYKPPPTRMQASDLPAFPHPCLYAGDFNCHHVEWGYDNSNPDGECLAGWVSANNFTLPYSPKEATSFYSGCWKTDTNPDLAFASVDLDSRLPDRRIVGKVTTPTLAYKSTQTCSSKTEQACKAMELPQGQLGPLFSSNPKTGQEYTAT